MSRLTVFLGILLVVIFMLTGAVMPLYIATVDYFIRAFSNGEYSPLRIMSASLVKTFGWEPKMIDKAPKVFASRLGFLCLLASSILVNLNLPTVAIYVSAMVTSLFLLDALGIVCVGCVIYHHIVFPIFNNK
jgi:hypothetical protein